jgi:uncharacterized protein (DUF983 family)
MSQAKEKKLCEKCNGGQFYNTGKKGYKKCSTCDHTQKE